jgi:hypothetical protein
MEKAKGLYNLRLTQVGDEMLYINTYLDKLGELVRSGDVSLVYELTDEKKIVEMFESDCREIMRLLHESKAEYEDVKRNLSLLKKYVISQLPAHYEKVKEYARSKGVEIDKELSGETINTIGLFIDEIEREL